MIIHRYIDGSEGYEYQPGDHVQIKDVIACGNWFKRAIGRTGPVTLVEPFNRAYPSWVTSIINVRDLPDWGPSRCFPWMVRPTPETHASAIVRLKT